MYVFVYFDRVPVAEIARVCFLFIFVSPFSMFQYCIPGSDIAFYEINIAYPTGTTKKEKKKVRPPLLRSKRNPGRSQISDHLLLFM